MYSGVFPPEQRCHHALLLCALWPARSLKLSNNALSSSIPSELGLLSYLSVLDLTNNGLTGTIPASLATITATR